MLRFCTKTELEQYMGFAFQLAMDPTTSGYPTYCDGVKTKDMFIERTRKAYRRETEQILLFELNSKAYGLIHFYWIPDDHYLATCLFLTSRETELALSEFLDYATEQFHGYDLYMGFPADNLAAVNYLAGHGFECIENDFNHTSCLDHVGSIPNNHDIIRVSKENYRLFQMLHSQIDGDMYWNSERICANLDQWVILLKQKDGKPQGAVYYLDEKDGWFEIFGIDIDRCAFQPALYKELLNAALQDAKRRGGKVMSFFCEEEYENVVRECGIDCVGRYLCYKIHLK